MLSADGGNRTPDRRVTKPLLYQLSYISKLKPVGRKCSALLELSDHQVSLAFQLPDVEVILTKPFPLVATSGIEPLSSGNCRRPIPASCYSTENVA